MAIVSKQIKGKIGVTLWLQGFQVQGPMLQAWGAGLRVLWFLPKGKQHENWKLRLLGLGGERFRGST